MEGILISIMAFVGGLLPSDFSSHDYDSFLYFKQEIEQEVYFDEEAVQIQDIDMDRYNQIVQRYNSLKNLDAYTELSDFTKRKPIIRIDSSSIKY